MRGATPNIQLLLTGNEIMSGDTIDSNSAMMAQVLAEHGLRIARKVTLGDDPAALDAELAELTQRADVVIINGGLGPTVDDLTAEILAGVAGVAIKEHAEARDHVERWCARRGATANTANLKQALLPEGCELVPNAVGSAVGFQLPVGQCLVICTPGVPGELRAMLPQVLDNMAQHLGDFTPGNVMRLQTFGLGESTAQQIIADAELDWPASVDLGFRAGAPQMEIKLTVSDRRHTDDQQRRRARGRHPRQACGYGLAGLGQRKRHPHPWAVLAGGAQPVSNHDCRRGPRYGETPVAGAGFRAALLCAA